MKKAIIIFIVLVLSGCASNIKPGTSHNINTPEIDMETAIDEYLIVTHAKDNQEKIISIMSDQMKKVFEQMTRKSIENRPFKVTENKDLSIQLLNKAMDNFITRYKKELQVIVPFSELEENVYGPVIKKCFSLDELQAIIGFYKSPAGEKYISMVPIIMQETTLKMNELYFAKIQNLASKIANEEMTKLKFEIELLEN